MSQMTEEEKKAADTAKAEEEESTDANAEDTSEEESEDGEADKEVDNKIDYEAELAKERDARKKAEDALAKKRFDASERKRKGEDADEGEPEEDKPLTGKQLETILAKDREQNQKILQETQAKEIVKGLATTEAEQNLILEIHKNRSFPVHLSLQEQMEESFAIANRKKLVGERNEAMRALKNKGNVNKNIATGHKDPITPGEPKMLPQDRQAIKGAGFVWVGANNRYEKKLSNGDTLVRDPKTKKTSLLKKAK